MSLGEDLGPAAEVRRRGSFQAGLVLGVDCCNVDGVAVAAAAEEGWNNGRSVVGDSCHSARVVGDRRSSLVAVEEHWTGTRQVGEH